MGKPTVAELETALQHAAQLREQGEDIYYIAKALLNLNYRMKYLEEVLDKVKLYLHSGEGAVEHALLIKAIEEAERASMAAGDNDGKMHPW
ncbi:MAG: hypothetical protein HW386_506 [Gammaproteobacteria bacterium]|nr:hypothetical protein [Gammaproteobacteria bacterium]